MLPHGHLFVAVPPGHDAVFVPASKPHARIKPLRANNHAPTHADAIDGASEQFFVPDAKVDHAPVERLAQEDARAGGDGVDGVFRANSATRGARIARGTSRVPRVRPRRRLRPVRVLRNAVPSASFASTRPRPPPPSRPRPPPPSRPRAAQKPSRPPPSRPSPSPYRRVFRLPRHAPMKTSPGRPARRARSVVRAGSARAQTSVPTRGGSGRTSSFSLSFLSPPSPRASRTSPSSDTRTTRRGTGLFLPDRVAARRTRRRRRRRRRPTRRHPSPPHRSIRLGFRAERGVLFRGVDQRRDARPRVRSSGTSRVALSFLPYDARARRLSSTSAIRRDSRRT